MQYFTQFPKITTTDYAGNSVQVTDILKRVEIIPNLLNNILLFYDYDIQDGDTPDIIASKYYNDPDRYWAVMYSNQMFDNASNWPMHQNLFNTYIVDKYTNATANALSISANTVSPSQVFAYTNSTVQQCIKNVTTVDSITNSSNTVTTIISEQALANTIQGKNSFSFSDGSSVSVTVSAYTQSIFDYENSLNESKRNIKLINSKYIGQV